MFQAGICCSVLVLGVQEAQQAQCFQGMGWLCCVVMSWPPCCPCGRARAAAVECPAVALCATCAPFWGAPALCHQPSLPLWLTAPERRTSCSQAARTDQASFVRLDKGRFTRSEINRDVLPLFFLAICTTLLLIGLFECSSRNGTLLENKHYL